MKGLCLPPPPPAPSLLRPYPGGSLDAFGLFSGILGTFVEIVESNEDRRRDPKALGECPDLAKVQLFLPR
jgi:hypothetical protein